MNTGNAHESLKGEREFDKTIYFVQHLQTRMHEI
jgi:hypothetical protein